MSPAYTSERPTCIGACKAHLYTPGARNPADVVALNRRKPAYETLRPSGGPAQGVIRPDDALDRGEKTSVTLEGHLVGRAIEQSVQNAFLDRRAPRAATQSSPGVHGGGAVPADR
jgi:hypothetical protein